MEQKRTVRSTPPIPPSSPTPSPAPPMGDRPPSEMQGKGRLIFQISTARGAIPLEGAKITVRHYDPSLQGGNGDVISVLYSGQDGKTEVLELPAPARNFSLEPAKDGAPAPYALYNADILLDNFQPQSYISIPVFDGITSIQRANLIPMPENGVADGVRPDGERFYEGESNDL